MIDSGSGAQLMTAGLAKQLQLEVLPTQLRIIQSGGTTFQTLGAVVVEVGLALGTPHAARSRHRVHIVEEHSSLPYTLVIGTEVMLRHGIQIDLPGRLLTYAPQLASHAHPQPRHALPLHFEPPAEWSSATMLSQCSLADPSSLMQGSPLWACVASPVISGGAEGSSGHTSACYLGVPEGKPSAASATSGCSHTPSVAEDQPGVEIRGPPLAPRSKPGRGMDRQQLPTRTPKHQPLGLGAARRRDRKQRAKAPTPLLERWSTAGKGLLDAMRKGCTLRNACAFLLILCALLPTMHACPPQQPQEVPALPCMFSCVTIAHTLPDGHQHLPPDARFTKHPKGMLFGHHPDMTAAQHHQLQAVIEAHDNAFSYSLSDLPGYHGPRPPLTIPLTTTEPVRSPPRRYSPIERQICSDKTAELLAAGIISPVEGPCSYAAAPVLPAKKDVHGNWTDKRFAIDYRQLNAATRPDIYGLPRPDELFMWAIKTLRPYLHGASFRLVTDHQPLTWLMTNPNLTGHHARWALSLQDYTFTIEHRPGNKHQNADVLSRWPLPCSLDGTGAQLDPDPAAALACFPSPTPTANVVWACASYWPFDSDYATHPADLLWGNLGGDLDATRHPPAPPALPDPTAVLHSRIAAMCQLAAPTLATLPPAVTFAGMSVGQRDAHGVAQPVRLNTCCIAGTFCPAATHGVVLLELFGGLCAGLEMCLRNGMAVKQYYYCDTDPAAQRVAHHRVVTLSAQYPRLLPSSAYATTFTTLPADVRGITTAHLVHAGAKAARPWLVVAGWECQDLSPAGTQAGMYGSHSSTHLDCLRIIGALQQLQRTCPPAYILENAAVQFNFSSVNVRSQFQPLCEVLGEPLCFDAAAVGSYAHRLRNYWTNMCDPAAAAVVVAQATTDEVQVQDILDPGRTTPLTTTWPPPPAWQCEVAGQPLRVLPTLVATPHSYAYRGRGPGLILNPDGTRSEPSVPERERALGYGTGATAAPGVNLQQRFAILGRCMDAYAMQTLLAISLTLSRTHPSPSLASCACVPEGSAGPQWTSRPPHPVGCTASPAGLAAAVVAAVEEDTDVHADIATLHFLRTRAHNPGQSATELRRVTRRAKAYRWDSNQLLRVMADGSTKVVPAPPARDQLVLAMHGSNGHFGVRRTTAILLHNHWWAGIHADVARVLRSCHVCDRARASFNLRAAQLSPLPVQGLFYRWGVDLAGPLPRTHRGHEYLMVCIEHLTKHVELVPIPDRLASTTAYHFHHQVLGRFGASAEVLTDGGREFQGEFADLLQRHLIDHRVTSPHHPQADGLAERAVQTFKDALRKHIAVSGDPAAWDEALPAIALGYRASPQEATKCSPYSLLYGRAPVLPPAVVQRMVRPINLDDPVVAAHDLLERSAVLSRETAAAMGNIRIAQHRDTLRYATTHSGSYKPAVRQLHPGSFVWTQRPQSNTLQLSARPEIYRVVSVGVNGVAKLQGKCGRVMAENVCNLAPCHLPDIDPTIDHTLARPTADFPCSICKSPTDAERMLLCDGCGKGFHTFCLTPKLTAVPEGSWLCAGCIGNGLTTQEVQRRTQDVAHQPQTSPLQEAFTTKQGRDRAQAAQLLHGRVARQPGTSRWGVVRFKGQQCHPHYFAVDWADGTITDKVSPTVLRNSRWLQPEGTVLPSLTLAPPVPGQRRSARLGHGENVGLAVACACPDSHGMALWA
ncbi:hypothetical protein QJQ45_005505 [Haematococcus lacustris]|nr:hypothetical protein QJQ45_005505 [Haematococcus lacustris]